MPGKQAKKLRGRLPRALRLSPKFAGRDPFTGERIAPHIWSAKIEKECIKLAKRGADIDEIAVIMNLRPGQVRMYYGIKIDRELALRNLAVEEAMYLNAEGFKCPDTYISVNLPQGSRTPIITKVALTKRYPPNVAAAQFILKNRSAASWKDDPALKVPPDEAAATIRALLKQMKEATG